MFISVVMELAARCGTRILPIDSERSAIFQAMQAGRPGYLPDVPGLAATSPDRPASLPRDGWQPPLLLLTTGTVDHATTSDESTPEATEMELNDLYPDRTFRFCFGSCGRPPFGTAASTRRFSTTRVARWPTWSKRRSRRSSRPR